MKFVASENLITRPTNPIKHEKINLSVDCSLYGVTASEGISQDETTTVDHSYKPLKLNLSDDGKSILDLLLGTNVVARWFRD